MLSLLNSSDIYTIISDPVHFFVFVNGYTPHEFQRTILSDESRKQLLRVGRQGGKTQVVASRSLWRAITRDKYKIIILSPTREQSSILYRKILDMVTNNPLLSIFIEGEPLKTQMFFKNGSSIRIVVANSTRGHTANEIIIDEAAYFPEDMFMAVTPLLAATYGNETLLSTPFGKQGKFYRASMPNSGYSTYHVPSTQIPHITQEFLDEERMNMTDNEFRQEHLAEFIEESDAFLPHRVIVASISDPPQLNEPDRSRSWKYYLGVDVARYGNDETTYVICRHTHEYEGIEVVYIRGEEKKPTTHTVGRITELFNVWRFEGIYVDETSLGGGVVDALRENRVPVTAVTFNEKCHTSGNPKDSNKEAMYKNLKWLMEKNADIRDWNVRNKDKAPQDILLKIPNNSKLVQQLSDLKYEYTSSGTLRVFHPEESKAHDDYPDALALSLYKFIERKRTHKKFYLA